MTVCHVDLIGPATDPCNTGAILDVLCPMHLVLNKTGHIIHVGPTLIKIRESEDWLGKRFLEVFSLKRPRSVNSAQDLEAVSGSKLHLQLRDPPTTNLKGVLVPGHIAGQLIVNLSFGISAVDAVRDYELTNTDFAPTDLTIEMLYLVEAKSAVMEASRKLNLRLQGAMIAAEEQAFTDTLTGLKNRRAFDMIIERHLVAGNEFALMQIDLDFFKTVNDSYGHAAGDHVLQTVARIMVAETRDADTVARLGGTNLLSCSPSSQTKTFCVLLGNASFPVLKSQFNFRTKFVRFRPVLGRCSKSRVIQQQPNSYMSRPTSHFMPRNGQGEGVRCSI